MKRIVVLLVLAMVAVCFVGCMPKKVEFEISDFDLEHDKGEYSETYEGIGEIETDAEGSFMVLVEYEKDGGAGEDEGFLNVLVTDGEGEFKTFDSSYSLEDGEELEEPDYEFTIIGYVEFMPVDAK